jgi:6-phosphogluconolactonase
VLERSNLIVVPDAATLAERVARHTLDAGAHALARHGRFDLALAGGSTPKAAYELLASPRLRGELDWNRVRFFFGDERCVPPDDDQSNFKMARTTLLHPLGIAPSAIFRMRGEDEPRAAAAAYADILRAELELDDTDAPVFDLVMLGMGPDGHTASLFPGTDPLEENELLVRAPYVAKFTTFRLTLTPKAIDAAHEIAVATAGDTKTDALAAVLDGPFDPTRYPIQIVRPRHGMLTWLVDDDAAAKLRSRDT